MTTLRSWRSEPKARSGAYECTGTACAKRSSSPYTFLSSFQRFVGTAERSTAGNSQFSLQKPSTVVG